jgi:hypothetical protein
MNETQTALQALRELLDNPERADWDKLVAASRALIKAIETGQSARRLADVIMIDRTAIAAAEIATLRQKLSAAEARIQIEARLIRCVNAWLRSIVKLRSGGPGPDRARIPIAGVITISVITSHRPRR